MTNLNDLHLTSRGLFYFLGQIQVNVRKMSVTAAYLRVDIQSRELPSTKKGRQPLHRYICCVCVCVCCE